MSEENTPKIGAGHAAAMARLGLRELRAAFLPESNIAQPHAEYGLYGTALPSEVAEARQADAMNSSRESVLADQLRQAEARDVHGRDSRSLERE
jgi:hypothetical protein